MGKKIRVHDKDFINQMISLARLEAYEVCIWGAGGLGQNFGRKMLEDLGIRVDYYCDNNRELYDKPIVNEIYCYDYSRLVKNKERTICFLILRSDYIAKVLNQVTDLGITNIVTYDDLLSQKEILSQYYPFTFMKKKIAYYTCIFGDYDELVDPAYISDNCDYYFLSDREPKNQTVYKWIDVTKEIPDEVTDPTRKNRYCKINAHKFFEDYRYSIYVDGHIRVKKEMSDLIYKLRKSRVGTITPFYMQSVYVEAMKCLVSGRDAKERVINQIERYWNEGMPEDFGVFLCGVLIREHNNPVCVKLMEDWWLELERGSKRDQISFPYVLWKNGYVKEDVFTICDENVTDPFDGSGYWEVTHGHGAYNPVDLFMK